MHLVSCKMYLIFHIGIIDSIFFVFMTSKFCTNNVDVHWILLSAHNENQKFQTWSVRTELEGIGALSRLSITQADVRHSGIYTCSVSDNISQSLRLHIIDGK